MQKITKLGILIILSALISCAKDSTTESTSSKGNTSTTTLKKDFSSAEDASQRVGGMTNSMITSRIVTSRVVTARMADTGSGTMPSAAPMISDNAIQDFILYKMKSKVMKKFIRFKAKEEMDLCAEFLPSFSTCEKLKPSCDLGGKAEILYCKEEQNRIEAKIRAENCKESGDEDIPDSLSTGTGTIYAECSSQGLEFKMGAKLEETTITFYQGNNPIYKVEFSPSISYVITMSSSYSTSAPRIDEKNTISSEISMKFDGNAKGSYPAKSSEQNMSFTGFKLTISMKQSVTGTTGHNEPLPGDDNHGSSDVSLVSIADFDISISGRYTVSTNPSWCGDGEYVVQTKNPLKFKEDSSCPYSGELQVNNATVQFTGSDKVKIKIGNSSKEYTCQELANSCQYDLENPLSLLPI